MYYLRSVTSLVVVLAMLRASNVAAQPPTPNELLAAMRSDSAELVNVERSATSYQCRTSTNQKQQVISERSLLVRRAGESVLIETENGNKRGCLNTHYMFGVARGREGGQWKLTEFTDNDRVREFDKNLSQHRYILFPLTSIGMSGTLQEKIDNPKFHITTTRFRPDGAIEAVFSAEETTPRGVVTLTGIITVSAKQRGLVLAYQHTASSGQRPVKFAMTRQVEEVGSRLQCRSLTFDLSDPKTGDVFQSGRTEFDDYGTALIDQSEFYLSHYGLPEPLGVMPPSNRRPRYVWLLIAAGSFAVLAILFYWRARRRHSPSAEPTTTPPTVN